MGETHSSRPWFRFWKLIWGICSFQEYQRNFQWRFQLSTVQFGTCRLALMLLVFIHVLSSAYVQKASRECAAQISGRRRPLYWGKTGGASRLSEHHGEQAADAGARKLTAPSHPEPPGHSRSCLVPSRAVTTHSCSSPPVHRQWFNFFFF